MKNDIPLNDRTEHDRTDLNIYILDIYFFRYLLDIYFFRYIFLDIFRYVLKRYFKIFILDIFLDIFKII